jgi:hypothetical protein
MRARITVASTLAPWVLGGSVTGYGPVRFRYAAELAQQIAARAAQPSAEAPSTPAVVSAPPVDVAALARAVVQGLRKVGVQAKAAAADASQPEVSRSLEALAEAVVLEQRKVRAEVLADAGLTAAVIEALSIAAHHARHAHRGGHHARGRTLLRARRRRDARPPRALGVGLRCAVRAGEFASPASVVVSEARAQAAGATAGTAHIDATVASLRTESPSPASCASTPPRDLW